MGGYQKVVAANGSAEPFQFETKHAVMPVRRLRKRQNLDSREQGFDLSCEAHRTAAMGTVSKFCGDDNADRDTPPFIRGGSPRNRSVRLTEEVGHDVCVQHISWLGHVRANLRAR